jgi:UDP-glucose 4-epimerase
MKFFITGGAGYIGAHLGTALQQAGHKVKIYDDFSNGLERRCSGRFSDVVKGNILDYEFLKKQMRGQDVVVHLAAKKSVEESIEKSDEYYETNVIGSKNVINSMIANGINKIIFSSTAAVYQANDNELIQENFTLNPKSPYGLNKLEIENFLTQITKVNLIAVISLRYFNVVGCSEFQLSDNSTENLVPKVFKKIEAKESPEIYGSDYPTHDGTCVRDYVHISDLISAHLKLFDYFENGNHQIFNVGSGTGYSVREVMDTIEKVITRKLDISVINRRLGDASKLVASIEKLKLLTGWKPVESLDSMIKSAWLGWCKNKEKND